VQAAGDMNELVGWDPGFSGFALGIRIAMLLGNVQFKRN
jgi:hypothetical protein